MGFVVAFFLGMALTVLILSLMRAAGSADRVSEAYWEGYRHGADDAEAGTVRPRGGVGEAKE